MTLRIKLAIGVAFAMIVLPIIIVYAQSEGETAAPADEPVVVIEETTPPTDEAAAPKSPSAEEQEATPSDEAVPEDTDEGQVLGESDEAAGEDGGTTEPPAQTVDIEVSVTSASSTEATSTPPVEEPKPKEEPLVLQPGVALSINGNTVSAAITLQNLTCSCGKELPEVEVLTYYTPWYPNDGPIADYAEASQKSATQARSVADVPVEATRDLTWSAEIPSGHYYFVVEVDPENANGAYRLFRSEFAI